MKAMSLLNCLDSPYQEQANKRISREYFYWNGKKIMNMDWNEQAGTSDALESGINVPSYLFYSIQFNTIQSYS